MEEDGRREIGVGRMMEEGVEERRGRPEEMGMKEGMDKDAKGGRGVREMVVESQEVEEAET